MESCAALHCQSHAAEGWPTSTACAHSSTECETRKGGSTLRKRFCISSCVPGANFDPTLHPAHGRVCLVSFRAPRGIGGGCFSSCFKGTTFDPVSCTLQGGMAGLAPAFGLLGVPGGGPVGPILGACGQKAESAMPLFTSKSNSK